MQKEAKGYFMSSKEWKKTQCNFCQACCGLEMQVENNHIVNVRPDPDSPRSQLVYCCRKGRAAMQFVDNPDRLEYPMKKVGDKHVRISWEQAFEEIGSKTRAIIEKYGPGSVFGVGGGNAAFVGGSAARAQLLSGIGTKHGFSPAGLEFMGFYWTIGRILGSQSTYTEPDDKYCDIMIFWGSNSYVSHNFADARKVLREFSENPKKKLIIVDPRVSETARLADIHILPRIGSDALLIRGLIAMILDKGWQDQAYLDKWALDFDQVRPWFEGFDYRKAFEVARVPYEQMEELAKIMCTNAVGIHQDLGLFMGRHSTANSYLMLLLMIVTGNLLVKGSILMHPFFHFENCDERKDPVRSPETNKFRVVGVYPCGTFPMEMLSKKENRLRVMFCNATNPVRSYPDSNAVEEGIKNLDLSVCLDPVMSDTARLCDYVLPAKTNYEAYEFTIYQMLYPDITLTLKHPVLDQIGERKEDGEIFHGLTKAILDVPEIPESLYQAAEKAVADKDRVPYMLAVMQYIEEHPETQPMMTYIVLETLGKAMGSIHKASLWFMLNVSPHAGTDNVRRAGFDADPEYAAMGPQVATISMMDKLFQAVDDKPQGVVGAIMEHEDRQKYAYEAISHPDHKLHLWCEEIEGYLERITPEKEEEALKADQEYPMLLSAGRHIDGGVNGMMRNPATYVYRKPYVIYMNPLDANRMGFKEGQEVRVTTEASSLDGPIQYDWGAAEGYILIPHHYGFNNQGKVYGTGANKLTAAADFEELTGNPHFRYVRCRIDAV